MKKFLAVIASATLLAFAVPAMAQEATSEERLAALEQEFQCSMKFYGSVRMTTFWYRDNNDFNPGRDGNVTRLDHNMQGNSRIGGRMEVGDLRGHFEYGHTGNPGNNVGLRTLSGEWNFGPGRLLLGQAETPTTFFTNAQAANSDACMLGWGSRYIGRQPMIQLSMGGFKFAAVRTFQMGGANFSDWSAGSANPAASPFAMNDREVTIPQLQASYTVRAQGLTANIAGAWQTYDVVDTVNFASENKKSIDSYMVALGAIYSIGPAALFGDFQFGQNMDNIQGRANGGGISRPIWDGVSMQDSDTFAFSLGARYRINDMIALEAAYGQSRSKVEANAVTWENTRKTYYLQMPITMARGVFIVPEAGVFDYGDREFTGLPDAPLGKQKYLGAKWQINF